MVYFTAWHLRSLVSSSSMYSKTVVAGISGVVVMNLWSISCSDWHLDVNIGDHFQYFLLGS